MGSVSVVNESIQEQLGYISTGTPRNSEDEYIGYYFLPVQVNDSYADEQPAKIFRKRGYRGRGGGRTGPNRTVSAPLDSSLGPIPEFTKDRPEPSTKGVKKKGGWSASNRLQNLHHGTKEDSTW